MLFDPVSSKLFQPSATRKAPSPTSEIVWPLQSSRKSLLRRAWSACAPWSVRGGFQRRAILPPDVGHASGRLRPAHEPGRQGGEHRKAEQLVARAAATSADVVVLPEKWNAIGNPRCCTAGRDARGRRVDSGDGRMGGTHGITLVGGSITERREGRDKLSNTSIVFESDGSIAGLYRKIHMFDVEVGGHVYRESDAEERATSPSSSTWRAGPPG